MGSMPDLSVGDDGAVRTSSIRHVLFDPAAFLHSSVTVVGAVAMMDAKLGRVDVAHDGAKLIVQIGSLEDSSLLRIENGEIDVSSFVAITGRIKKQQRRTYMEATSVEVVTDD